MRVFLLTGILAAICLTPSAWGQAEADARLVDEVAGIHKALKRLVQLMEAAEARSDADLLLRRIDLMERRIAPLQGRVSTAEGEVHGLEMEIHRMRTYEQEIETSIDDAIREGRADEETEAKEMQSQLRSELKRLVERLEIVELRKRQAEDDLADAREEIESLDEILLELLSPR